MKSIQSTMWGMSNEGWAPRREKWFREKEASERVLGCGRLARHGPKVESNVSYTSGLGRQRAPDHDEVVMRGDGGGRDSRIANLELAAGSVSKVFELVRYGREDQTARLGQPWAVLWGLAVDIMGGSGTRIQNQPARTRKTLRKKNLGPIHIRPLSRSKCHRNTVQSAGASGGAALQSGLGHSRSSAGR